MSTPRPAADRASGAIEARPDHVAVAVPDMEVAWRRWHGDLGGAWWSQFHNRGVFVGRQVRYHGGAKLEVLAPSPDDDGSGFLPHFLDRRGPGVHHVTLKVPDLERALDVLADAGLDAVDVDLRNPAWQEAFLRPSQVGGIVVQVATSDRTDEQWAAAQADDLPEPEPTAGPRLLGPLLGHPDLDHAAWTWERLGGTVSGDVTGRLVSWPDAPLTVRLVPAERAGAIGVRFEGAGTLPADEHRGPAVVVD